MKYLILLSVTCLCFFTSCSSDDPVTGVTPTPGVQEEENEDLPAAPDFSLKTLDDTDVSLTQFKDKVLVIFFFGHNCPPCVSVGPTIEDELNQAFSDKSDFEMIGIDVWDGNNAQVQSFKDKTTASYPLGLKGSSVGTAFSSGRDRLVVINREGNIAFNGKQVAKNDLNDVKDLLNSIL